MSAYIGEEEKGMEDMVVTLSEFDAKRMLMSAVDVMEKTMVCEHCVKQTVCGSEATHDSCKRMIVEELRRTKRSPETAEETDNAETAKPSENAAEDGEGIVYYDPKTMQITD